LGVPIQGLERLALGAGHREARYGDRLASQGISSLLDWKIRHGRMGRPGVSYEVRDLIRRMSRENPLGRTPHPRGIAQTGHQDQ
jgi:hypothetical protein